MIKLTVKTLDSQNHNFTVDDDMTVAQFKEKIADTVNIPADTQRIIYCGRVLQDSSKLNEYDVNGKVVHLVQRPPPSTNPQAAEPEPPPSQPAMTRRIRGYEYLGSLRVPANVDTSAIPHMPTQSLAVSRLNIARRMIRRAESVLTTLENPIARAADQPAPEGPIEMTPVFEARVIVPTEPQNNDSIGGTVVLSAVNSLMNSALRPVNGTQTTGTPNVQVHVAETLPSATIGPDPIHSVSSTPELTSLAASSEHLTMAEEEQSSVTHNDNQVSASPNEKGVTATPNEECATATTTANDEQGSTTPNEDQGSATSNEDQGSASPNEEQDSTSPNEEEAVNNETNNANTSNNADHISRTSEFADLLEELSRVHSLFVPFLDEYYTFMRDDPITTAENARNVQGMINRVSEILHFLGHAYHSLSDIIVRVRSPPPRPLLCRPILIQQSAIVQTGIPIQVEAQFNFSTNQNPNGNTPSTTQTSATNQTTVTNSNQSTVGNCNQTTVTSSNQGTVTTTADSNTGRTIPSHFPPGFPLVPGGIRVQTFHIPSSTTNSEIMNAVNNHNRSRQQDVPVTESNLPQTQMDSSNNNFSITFAGRASSPEFTARTGLDPTAIMEPMLHTADTFMNPSTNNDTEPGRDCSRNREATGNQQPAANIPVEFFVEVSPGSDTFDTIEGALIASSNHTNNILQEALNPPPELIQSIMQMAGQLMNRGPPNGTANIATVVASAVPSAPQPESSTDSQTTTTSASTTTTTTDGGAARVNAFQNSQARGNTQTQPTTATHTRSTARPHVHFSQHSVQGFDPFLPCSSHHLNRRRNIAFRSASRTQGGTTAQNNRQSGEEPRNVDPSNPFFNILRRIINTVHHAYTANQGTQQPSTNGIATTATPNDLTLAIPNLENTSGLETRDNIDIVRSVQTLLRGRLPNIISSAMSSNPNSSKMMVDQIRTTGRQLCALAVRASRNGREGVENIVNVILTHYMQGIPSGLYQWTMMTSRAHMMLVLSSLDVPESILQPYIVREVDPITPTVANETETMDDNTTTTNEMMQVDEIPSGDASPSEEQVLPVMNLTDDAEPLPQVVYGSETWHGHMPSEWVPIISRDSQRQRRQNTQPPFSDAYLSGMPSKRRKIVSNSKPQGSLPQVITESVRQAVSATGLTGVAPLETVAAAAGADLNIQSAYRNLLRTSVRSGLSNNEDFTPERFPNVNNYFNNYPQ
ncbi:hypothetical protein FQA39_LY10175 [Lamprigera yunnana]|nr:hypothetical protein FQA39_LY10175 [Lamprigera yunnana]